MSARDRLAWAGGEVVARSDDDRLIAAVWSALTALGIAALYAYGPTDALQNLVPAGADGWGDGECPTQAWERRQTQVSRRPGAPCVEEVNSLLA